MVGEHGGGGGGGVRKLRIGWEPVLLTLWDRGCPEGDERNRVRNGGDEE